MAEAACRLLRHLAFPKENNGCKLSQAVWVAAFMLALAAFMSQTGREEPCNFECVEEVGFF